MKISRRFINGILVCVVLVLAGEARPSQVQDLNELKPVIVSASRSPMPSTRVADQVEVLTKEDLKYLPVKNLAEALKYVPGVDIQHSGPFGQATSVSIHGSESRQVLVMIDGIPFNTQLSGQANLSRIPIESIEQIDVIKGGASSAWGSSLGGVINVITRPVGTTAKPQGKLTSSYGSFASTKNSLELRGKQGALGYSSFGSYLHAHGNKADSYTREIKNFTKLAYDFNDEASLNASFGFSGADLRYGPTISRAISDQPYISRYGTLQFKVEKEENRFNAAYKYHDQDITTDSYNSTTKVRTSSTVSHNFYQGLSLNDVQEFSGGEILTTGVDFDWHLLKSTSFLTKARGINTQAPYANIMVPISNWDFIPGLRYDHNSHFGSQLSPSFGAVYHVPGWKDGVIRAKVARVFSAPPLLWLYNSAPALLVAPNPDLKAERAMSYELGAKGPLGIEKLQGSLDLYRSDVKDAIAVVSSGGLFQSQNFNKFVRQGVEGRLDYAMTANWSIFTSGNFNDVRNAETRKIVRSAGIARHSFKWGSLYQFPCGLDVSVQSYYNRWSSSPGQAHDSKAIVDIRLIENLDKIWSAIDAEIFLNVYNIGDSKHWSSPTFPLPGRYVEGGVSINF